MSILESLIPKEKEALTSLFGPNYRIYENSTSFGYIIENNHITELHLSNKDYEIIPEQIKKLHYIQFLNLNFNNISKIENLDKILKN